MTMIPNVILCANVIDKVQKRKEYLQWSSDVDYGTQFLTQEEIDEQGYVFDGYDD